MTARAEYKGGGTPALYRQRRCPRTLPRPHPPRHYAPTSGTAGTLYLAQLGEGDFFGEVSVLTGKPRTATITAAQRTELLRLDKTKLDGVLAKFPGIRKVLDEFYVKRAEHTVEAMIESLKKR